MTNTKIVSLDELLAQPDLSNDDLVSLTHTHIFETTVSLTTPPQEGIAGYRGKIAHYGETGFDKQAVLGCRVDREGHIVVYINDAMVAVKIIPPEAVDAEQLTVQYKTEPFPLMGFSLVGVLVKEATRPTKLEKGNGTNPAPPLPASKEVLARNATGHIDLSQYVGLGQVDGVHYSFNERTIELFEGTERTRVTYGTLFRVLARSLNIEGMDATEKMRAIEKALGKSSLYENPLSSDGDPYDMPLTRLNRDRVYVSRATANAALIYVVDRIGRPKEVEVTERNPNRRRQPSQEPLKKERLVREEDHTLRDLLIYVPQGTTTNDRMYSNNGREVQLFSCRDFESGYVPFQDIFTRIRGRICVAGKTSQTIEQTARQAIAKTTISTTRYTAEGTIVPPEDRRPGKRNYVSLQMANLALMYLTDNLYTKK
ncbi:MAG: hypothetical protein WC254_06590 [Candidatus Woesearchaeota archaeon]|jgi:hypothetical protein